MKKKSASGELQKRKTYWSVNVQFWRSRGDRKKSARAHINTVGGNLQVIYLQRLGQFEQNQLVLSRFIFLLLSPLSHISVSLSFSIILYLSLFNHVPGIYRLLSRRPWETKRGNCQLDKNEKMREEWMGVKLGKSARLILEWEDIRRDGVNFRQRQVVDKGNE